uniref:RGS domain-containing protein n=1 Tax=Ciona savignyi TaxID=51511 RepID=H2YE86_CIOSA
MNEENVARFRWNSISKALCFDSINTIRGSATAGQIYMGDHMTRSWTKDGRVTSQIGSKSTPGTPDNRDPRGSPADRKTSIKKGKEVCEPSGAQVNPQVSFRKPNGKRRIKSAKELILHCTIKPHDLEEWNVSFDSLLKSPAGRFVFRVFLESEIADENLKFWLACEDLKNTTKQKRIEKRIQDIYDTYINVYSPHEVNIDYKMRENIVDQLKDKVDVSIFTEAQHQIYTLMHRDSYPRFLSSSLTAEITKEVMEQNQRAEDLNTKPDRSFEFISCC